ncbi:unnamed protein product [Rhizoctonia solani]|uniref:MYND-type domain-containing protein n=1 Tax=Rhizoctonia solani TaxID=456999 RepID=A0A8H3HYA1_9AGAM|nr:unnamed protein product [Rhizoctonia solani]
MQPFSRILWRYLLAIPSFSSESEAILAIHNQIAPMVRLNDNNFIDLDDSRYVLLAFIGRLTETPPMMVGESAALMRFVEPLIVPGCEDLVPDMIQGTIEIMWDSAINQPAESDIVRFAIGSHLLHFRQIFIKLRPSYDHEQPWIEKVVDNILHGDLVDVIVRSMLTATEFNPDSANAETKLFSAAVETFAELSRLYTSSGIATRLQESGKLLDWFKYTDHFFDVGSFVEEFVDKYDFECINTICGQLIYGIMGALVGEHRMELLRPIGGSCDNPRCPVPLGATLVCSQCEDLIYCTPWCLRTDWMGAWGGPHRRVCEAQSRKDPGLRFSYHSRIGVPSGFYEGVKRDGGSAPRLAEFVLRAVREQTGRPRF